MKTHIITRIYTNTMKQIEIYAKKRKAKNKKNKIKTYSQHNISNVSKMISELPL